jgi:hypothetical protein
MPTAKGSEAAAVGGEAHRPTEGIEERRQGLARCPLGLRAPQPQTGQLPERVSARLVDLRFRVF